jgi:hypothetical protein
MGRIHDAVKYPVVRQTKQVRQVRRGKRRRPAAPCELDLRSPSGRPLPY